MNATSSRLNSPNWKERGNRFRKVNAMTLIGKKGLGELPIRSKDIIDVQWKPAREAMDLKVLSTSISNSNIMRFTNS